MTSASAWHQVRQAARRVSGPQSPAWTARRPGIRDRSRCLDEKDANGVRFADGGEQHGRARLQGHDILFKSGGHLKSPPPVCVAELFFLTAFFG